MGELWLVQIAGGLRKTQMFNPWSYAEKTRTEHSEQVALFAWSSMATIRGSMWANERSNWSPEAMKASQGMSAADLGVIPLPQLKWLHAIHNQGHGDAIRGSNAKAEGVKAGVFDLFLPVSINTQKIANGYKHYAGLYIELKRKDAGKPSDIQLDFQKDMREAGYKAEICHGWEAARDEILAYLI